MHFCWRNGNLFQKHISYILIYTFVFTYNLIFTQYRFKIQSVGLYTTNNVETNKFILEDSKANILVLDNETLLRDIQQYRDQLPFLKKIILWDGNVPENLPDVLSWNDVMKIGMDDTNNEPLFERQKKMAINQCCTMVYTSGTTGNPKGNLKCFVD